MISTIPINNSSITNNINMTEYVNTSITLPDRVYKKIEKKRGQIPRSTYISAALEDYFRFNKEVEDKK